MIVYVNGEPREVVEPVTIADLVADGGETPRGIAIALDGAVIPRADHRTTALADGARIEIVTAVQGG